MKKLDDKTIAILAVALIVIGSGITPVFVKIAVKEISPEYLSFLRFFLASLVLAPIFLKNRIKFNKDFVILILVSLLLTLNILAFSYGLKTTTATIGQLLYALSPIFIAVFSYFLVKDKITNKKILGIFLGILGTGIVLLLPQLDKESPFSGNLMGNVFVMVGVISTALHTSISQKLHLKFTPIHIAMAFFFTTALITLVLSFSEVIQTPSLISSISQKALLSVIFVGLLTTPLLYVAYQYAIKHGSPLIASTNFFLTPFSTLIWAFILLGEGLTPLLAIGGIVVLLGTYFIVKETKPAQIDR